MTPPQISGPGFYVVLANAHQAFGGNVTQTIVGLGSGFTTVVMGIDAWSSAIVGESHGYYNIAGSGKLLFGSHFNDDPLNETAAIFTWRGAIPLGTGEHLEVGAEMQLPAQAQVTAFGLHVPYPPGNTL